MLLCLYAIYAKAKQIYQHLFGCRGDIKTWVDYGKFQLTTGKFYGDIEKDKGLQTNEDAKFYTLSTRFKPFSNENKTLVVQSIKILTCTLSLFAPVRIIVNKIDNKQVEAGDLEDDWAFLPPRKIKDPYDWEDFEYIPDPDTKKPDDWNEAMDGEWEGPLTPNLKYKGQWEPRIIDNSNYEGEWIHPEIDNPEYKPDPNICHYYISVLGLDLWQMKSGSIFDNFLLTNDEEFAEEVGNMTWGARKSHSHGLICWLHGPERQGKEFVFIGHLKPCT
ncbi:hypothetical protein AB1E18_001968 [Capra hircus]